MRIVSKRPTMKQANEHANGTRPVSASPAAMPTMLDSAMPRLKARPGNFLAKPAVMVDFDRSASRVTMRSSFAPSWTSASPTAPRLALAGIAPPLTPCRGLLLVECAQLADDGRGRLVGLEIAVPGRVGHAEDLADGGHRLRGLRRLAVPLRVVLHERHALALDGVRHHQRRRALRGLGLVERLVDLRHVVAVDLDHRPAERLPLGDDGLEIEHLADEVVELDLVVVDDDGEVVERMIGMAEPGRRHGRFPHLALLDLAVAEDAVDARGRARELGAERQPERDREALPERAGGRLDAGQRDTVGMALERRAELAQRDQRVFGEVAGLRHHAIERRHGVALSEHDAVALPPVWAA